MGSWNYRIIDFGGHKALHEVHYDDDGSPNGWTEEPADFGCGDDEAASAITNALAMAAYDAARQPVLKVRNDKLVSADLVSRGAVTPELLTEFIQRRTMQPAREIALRVRKQMMTRLDDDVIGRITEAHIVFGTACAFEALNLPPPPAEAGRSEGGDG